MRVTVFGASSRLGDQIWRKALDDGFKSPSYSHSSIVG